MFLRNILLFDAATCVALRRRPPAVWIVILGNAAWVLASVAVLFGFSPTVPGYVFVIVQAVAVAFLAELEYTGLRRAVA